MIIKCPNCGAALSFDEHSQKVVCEYCDASFDISELEIPKEETTHLSAEEVELSGLEDDDAYMGLNVYSCTSCGGQIMVNGVESSTFCSFCGQPTVLFDRVEKSKKPKYILPFSFPKEQVEPIVRKKITSSFFATKEVKEFKTECIRGIYIPFWLMDVNYQTSMVLKGTHKSGKTTITSFYYRKAHTYFEKLTLDASQQLNDECSQRLEPYNLKALKPFQIQYLTGFYSDSLDLEAKELESLAKKRAKELFDPEIIKTVKDTTVTIYNENSQAHIAKKDYALLPVWFLSFHIEDKPYTFLINGQTGKMIGAVDYNKSKMTSLVLITTLLLVFPSCMMAQAFLSDPEEYIKSLMFILGAIILFFIFGLGFSQTISENLERTQSKNMFKLVKKRQGR